MYYDDVQPQGMKPKPLRELRVYMEEEVQQLISQLSEAHQALDRVRLEQQTRAKK